MGPPNGIHGTNETLAPTIRSVLADVVKKVVEEETRQGCSSVVARMLSNADKAWAEYCHRAGIDRDTPLGSPFLPDDGSGEEALRAQKPADRLPARKMLSATATVEDGGSHTAGTGNLVAPLALRPKCNEAQRPAPMMRALR
ncbi:hypothetical protein B0H65DRAFT_544808 [Neurospora tetraspora]|uniref:Uncharacterized protein n=1 Tax=Neurospora tetraspora TaxID=94610 RepID=A0AAE0JQ21_9PEZI|nr:hypothetical protein B0H65DRAFT_544808 [Neurospora tetraspora]